MSWPQGERGLILNLRMKWANVGVGKLYHAYALRFFLFEATGGLVFTGDGKADPREWLPGERDLTESFLVPPTLNAGEYLLALALVDPRGERRPFRLAIDAPQNQERYELSRLKVE